ncbi:aminodeoxychorismate synthase component I [Frigidibacter sp. MR17.24]|uniref:aminodeoxychorismate synthase component I n=1 Tax=Frigidibacter sp. MR17.24 TaxID=3127345 RepID=UPI003012D9B9
MMQLVNGPGGQPVAFDRPRAVLRADTPAEVWGVLEAAEAARRAGGWIAGMIAYEAAAAFEPRLADLPRGPGPLVHLGVFDAPGPLAPAAPPPVQPPSPGARPDPEALGAFAPLVPQAEHEARVARVLDYIAAGDCYQVNLTFPMEARCAAAPAALWSALRARQPVPHAALVTLPEAPALVSLSPESFFALDGAGGIATRPMKGTRPRDPDPARDAAAARALARSEKDRAENLMIVDLLRNDISRLCRPGTVRVPELWRVEHYATVHQMVSEVRGTLAGPLDLPELIAALFPCGSVTGAPKIRAMQVIAALEGRARGAYCGAIGWAAPDGRAAFNVAIRTLAVQDGRARLDVGGGIVHDSTPRGEWEEALWKSRFARPLWPPETA